MSECLAVLQKINIPVIIWKSEQDVIKEDKEPFLKLQQTDNDDQVYRDKDILVNELDTEYEKNDAKQANEGGIGQRF